LVNISGVFKGMSRDKGFKRVDEALEGALRSLGVEGLVDEYKVVKGWERVVGGRVAEKSRARRINHGLLFVEVENNVWMQEIRFHEREIIAKMKRMFPGVRVKGLKLKLERKRGEE
jgi:predicted nucleic acid-binding Zn ribbon protein